MTRPARGSLRSRTAAAVVVVVNFLAFLPSLTNGFVTWDDDRNFLDNLAYRGLGWDNLKWMWTTFHMGHYVPLSWMTLGLDYEIWGMDARGYHFTNLVLHCLNALLIFWIIRDILRLDRPDAEKSPDRLVEAAAIGALIFSIHPLRVESVAWATERRDVLAGTFYWSAILFYLRGARATGRLGGNYWIAVAMFVCALLSKATSVTLPAVLLLLNLRPLRRISIASLDWRSVRPVLLELIPFALGAAAIVPLTIVALKPPDQLTAGAKVAVSAYGLVFYLMKTVLPFGLSPLYPMPTSVDPLEARFVASYACVAIIAGALCWYGRRRPAAALCFAAFAIVILPMLGVVQNGPQIAADRYTYHAAPALSALFAGVLLVIPPGSFRTTARPLAWTSIAVLSVLTWRQTTNWHDPERFWSSVVDRDSSSAIALTGLASVRMSQNRVDDAIALGERAVRADPSYAEGHDNLGIAYARAGRHGDAIRQFQEAIAIAPNNRESHGNLGVELALAGRLEDAVVEYQRAVALDPAYAAAHVNWGNALVREDRLAEAIDHYRQAVQLKPDLPDAYLNWGVALAREHRFRDAIEKFRSVLQLDASSRDAAAYLAGAVAMVGDSTRGR